MPQLTNTKWEAFSRALSDGLKVMDAYTMAGYPRSPSAASQLKARPEVQARVHELLAERRAKGFDEEDDVDNLPSELNREWLMKTLMKNIAIAQRAGQIAPANKAVELLAELINISFKRPNGIPPEDEDDTGDDKAPLDLDKMSDAIGKLGKLLPTEEEQKKQSEGKGE